MFSDRIRSVSKKIQTKTNRMMGYMKNGTRTKMSRFFVRQRLPAKKSMCPFRFTSRILFFWGCCTMVFLRPTFLLFLCSPKLAWGVRQTHILNLFRIDKFVHKALSSAFLTPSLLGCWDMHPTRSAGSMQSARSCSCWRSATVFSGHGITRSVVLLSRWTLLRASLSGGTRSAPGSRLPSARTRPYARGPRSIKEVLLQWIFAQREQGITMTMSYVVYKAMSILHHQEDNASFKDNGFSACLSAMTHSS